MIRIYADDFGLRVLVHDLHGPAGVSDIRFTLRSRHRKSARACPLRDSDIRAAQAKCPLGKIAKPRSAFNTARAFACQNVPSTQFACTPATSDCFLSIAERGR